MIKMTLVTGILVSLTQIAFAQRSEYLGTVSLIDSSRERIERIHIREVCNVDSIRISIRSGEADIGSVGVQYENGRVERVSVRRVMRSGDSSRWLSLRDSGRCVRSIDVAGRSINRNRGAQVEFFANTRYDRPDYPDHGNGRSIEIGTTTLSPLGSSKYVNTRDICDLRAVKVRVLKEDARIDHISVQFANGQTQRLDVREDIRQNDDTRWIDLNGRERCITGFSIVGHTENLSIGIGRGIKLNKAKVQLIGRN